MRVPEKEVDDLSIELDFFVGIVSRGERMVSIGGRSKDERPREGDQNSDLRVIIVSIIISSSPSCIRLR